MKFLALKNFYFRDKKTDQERSINEGEIFEVDDFEIINSLILDLRITPSDSSILPEVSWYKVIHGFSENFGEEFFGGKPHDEIRLRRPIACNLLARGFIRPSDPDAWYPQRLGFAAGTAVKKMYDSEG